MREHLLGSFDARVGVLERIADSSKAAPKDRLKAIDLMGKYGLGQQRTITIEGVRDKLTEQIRVIRDTLPPELAEELLGKLRQLWR